MGTAVVGVGSVSGALVEFLGVLDVRRLANASGVLLCVRAAECLVSVDGVDGCAWLHWAGGDLVSFATVGAAVEWAQGVRLVGMDGVGRALPVRVTRPFAGVEELPEVVAVSGV